MSRGCMPLETLNRQCCPAAHSLLQAAAHTRRRARFASRAAAFAAAASAGDSPLPAASEAAAAAAAPCPGGRGGLPVPGGFSVFRLRTGMGITGMQLSGEAAVASTGPALQQAALAVNTGPQAVHASHAMQHKSGLRAPYSCYTLVAALLLLVIFLYTSVTFSGAPRLQTTKAAWLCRRTEPEKSVSASSSLSDSVAYSSSARSSAKKSCFQKSSSAPSWSSMSCTVTRKDLELVTQGRTLPKQATADMQPAQP